MWDCYSVVCSTQRVIMTALENKSAVTGELGGCSYPTRAHLHICCCLQYCFTDSSAEFDLQFVNLQKGEHKQPAHLARQPFGLVPAIDANGFLLYESRAIMRYINDTRGNKLVPADPKAKAMMEQWLSLEQGTFSPDVGSVDRHCDEMGC
jgi:glutathione S-transferase